MQQAHAYFNATVLAHTHAILNNTAVAAAVVAPTSNQAASVARNATRARRRASARAAAPQSVVLHRVPDQQAASDARTAARTAAQAQRRAATRQGPPPRATRRIPLEGIALRPVAPDQPARQDLGPMVGHQCPACNAYVWTGERKAPVVVHGQRHQYYSTCCASGKVRTCSHAVVRCPSHQTQPV
jgi:hypothetical protein